MGRIHAKTALVRVSGQLRRGGSDSTQPGANLMKMSIPW